MTKVVYIISDIDKALAFEWINEKIDKRKFTVSFYLLLRKPAYLETYLREKNVAHSVNYYSDKKSLIAVCWKLFRQLRKKKPDVVHCHLLYGSIIGLTAARLAGIDKRIYTRHHSDYHHRYFPKGIKWDRWCNGMATKVVAPSNSVAEILIKYEKLAENKIVIIPHGFDLSYFSTVDASRVDRLKIKYKVAEHSIVVGVIARFTELKGIQYIIPAFQKLLKTHPSSLLLLFNAKGDYEQQIKAQLLDLVPENNYRLIAFENDIAAVYQLFDIFVQASTDRDIEAFGQTYVEALAAGIPSIFTLSGIAPDFIRDQENALVVPFKNSEAIYLALEKLSNDKDLARRLACNGKASVQEKFALQKMINALENLYEQ